METKANLTYDIENFLKYVISDRSKRIEKAEKAKNEEVKQFHIEEKIKAERALKSWHDWKNEYNDLLGKYLRLQSRIKKTGRPSKITDDIKNKIKDLRSLSKPKTFREIANELGVSVGFVYKVYKMQI